MGDPTEQETLRLKEIGEDGGIPFRFPSTLSPSSAWVSREVAGLASDGTFNLRPARDELGRDIAETGRGPYPMELEKFEVVEREAVDPVRDIVDEAKELPRVCVLFVLTAWREGGAAFFSSVALAVFGRVASCFC